MIATTLAAAQPAKTTLFAGGNVAGSRKNRSRFFPVTKADK
jgi:hypothetical protein